MRGLAAVVGFLVCVELLASTGSIADPEEGHAPLAGYLTVWSICAIAALLAALALLSLPKQAAEHPVSSTARRRR